MHNDDGAFREDIWYGIATKNDTNAANDFAHARSTASRLDFDYEEVKLDHRSYLDTTHELIGHLATPLATPTDVVIYRVAARLRKSVGVALGGEGADEAFCGYSVPHWSGYDFERAQHHCPSQTPHSTKFLRAFKNNTVVLNSTRQRITTCKPTASFRSPHNKVVSQRNLVGSRRKSIG